MDDETAPRSEAAAALRHIVAARRASLLAQPSVTRAMLSDELGPRGHACRDAVALLGAVAEGGVASELGRSNQVTGQELTRLVTRVTSQADVSSEAAAWAVRAWADALGVAMGPGATTTRVVPPPGDDLVGSGPGASSSADGGRSGRAWAAAAVVALVALIAGGVGLGVAHRPSGGPGPGVTPPTGSSRVPSPSGTTAPQPTVRVPPDATDTVAVPITVSATSPTVAPPVSVAPTPSVSTPVVSVGPSITPTPTVSIAPTVIDVRGPPNIGPGQRATYHANFTGPVAEYYWIDGVGQRCCDDQDITLSCPSLGEFQEKLVYRVGTTWMTYGWHVECVAGAG